ncbi:DUF1513 domain-containing protein [Marinomonas epiphytica]
MLTRRQFLASSTLAISTKSWSQIVPSSNASLLYASAYSKEEAHYFGLFNESGTLLWSSRLDERAHAPVIHPTQAIMGIVARRPGFYMDFFDLESHTRLKQIQPQAEHHFYGHALFTKDGKQLISQENHYPTGQGKIVIRDWPSGRISHEYSSNGIGPHESVLFNDDTLIIANGGLKTHPNNDRKILNLDTMQPNLTYLSLNNGKVLNTAKNLPEHFQLSIRHLDVNQDGLVAIGFQHQGELWEQVPLAGVSSIHSQQITPLPMPEAVRARFKQYCGSVRFDKSGKLLAISTPRGGLVAYWHVPTQTFLGVNNVRDVCGICATNNAQEFLLTSGNGKQFITNPAINQINLINKQPQVHWDNHIGNILNNSV